MADDDASQKTEEPTQKRLDEAHDKGQVAVSRELNHWFMFGGGLLAVFVFGPQAVRDVSRAVTRLIERPHAIAADINALTALFSDLATQIAYALAPMMAVLMVAAAAGSLLQAGLILAPEQIMPKFERVSPAAGFKRLFSLRAVIELLKGIAKLVVVGAVAWFAIAPYMVGIERFVLLAPEDTANETRAIVLVLMAAVMAAMTAIAGADLLYQRLALRRQLRMSREELREEFKQAEGDPHIKGRLKQIRAERARRRMMADVPKADVVITNPTHFAVALKYEQGTMSAPRVVAKGADVIAAKIREVATANEVPIVENPPLARALYATVDLDEEIPAEHYRAVAEVIGYVMRLKGRLGGRPEARPAGAAAGKPQQPSPGR
jgi:flagellar biosynthetic protein FlhB